MNNLIERFPLIWWDSVSCPESVVADEELKRQLRIMLGQENPMFTMVSPPLSARRVYLRDSNPETKREVSLPVFVLEGAEGYMVEEPAFAFWPWSTSRIEGHLFFIYRYWSYTRYWPDDYSSREIVVKSYKKRSLLTRGKFQVTKGLSIDRVLHSI